MKSTTRLYFLLAASLLFATIAAADDSQSSAAIEYRNQIRPLVERYCNDCHSGETTEADIDLGAFATHADVRRQVDVWLKVRTMLDSRQMPPKDSRQPTDDQRKLLQTWVREFLAREAEATAGDPGPVVLRRLNNEEYNYSVRDLTGVASLDPTREFPVDGAFEQIREFATQDRPDLVKVWDPLKPQVIARADAFRKRLLDTEPAHLAAVLEFAGRAWRRPLTGDQRAGLSQFYRNLRTADMSHEDAIRLTLARVLTSPAFLYRREVQSDGSQPQPVTDLELAIRLSYFLWSSVPDAELREAAAAGRLTASRGRPRASDGNSDASGLPLNEELLRQTRRMLQDPRTRRLAIQFACQWLHLRGFDQDDNKNEKLYPEFAALRGDMYEETVRFFEDMFRSNGSILDVLDADHTFLNEALAKHYGIDDVDGPQWRRVDSVRSHARGGILGMASLLASQSGASRTSPILRGNWVYETLLGERLPRPPANVPQLPDDVPEGLTGRQLIEKHSSAAACAKCHVKIDPFGFALEQYDAIGRLRPAGVDTRTKLEDGTEIDGIEGLREYLLTKRRNDVVRQFCRKLLGFALGREVQLSDEVLLAEMLESMEANDYRFHAAVEAIVLSPQFRNIRGSSQDTGASE